MSGALQISHFIRHRTTNEHSANNSCEIVRDELHKMRAAEEKLGISSTPHLIEFKNFGTTFGVPAFA